ncbi:MAG: ATP-binding protein [Bacteroidales bacterium]|nr:ATP-binding protein [Bacteroidales bacterium]
MKIIWFANSGFIDGLLREINFKSLILNSDKYEIGIIKEGKDINLHLTINNNIFHKEFSSENESFFLRRALGEFHDEFKDYSEESIFFPTFRRIEGGFLMESRGPKYRRDSFPLKDALSELSDNLSSDKHLFIASVSTDDITMLLNREYSTIVREINELQRKQFEEIRKKIKNKKNKQSDEILSAIENDINTVEQKRDDAMKPFTALEELIMKIFHKKGIELDMITFGDSINAISSDKLSAGEKQMLSFLCYNTFSKNKVIIIDEPELSLHPDWQRLLIPTLLKQGNNNQFFIATHSPFIYTKYPDKEIVINSNKGE